jgi:hypothetical protein
MGSSKCDTAHTLLSVLAYPCSKTLNKLYHTLLNIYKCTTRIFKSRSLREDSILYMFTHVLQQTALISVTYVSGLTSSITRFHNV